VVDMQPLLLHSETERSVFSEPGEEGEVEEEA
jgi:hypothetical protein